MVPQNRERTGWPSGIEEVLSSQFSVLSSRFSVRSRYSSGQGFRFSVSVSEGKRETSFRICLNSKGLIQVIDRMIKFYFL